MQLRRPAWTAAQQFQMQEKASVALRQFILNAQLLNSDGEIEWTMDGTANECHVQLYTGKTPQGSIVVAAATQIRGTLEQAALIAEQLSLFQTSDLLESLAIASIESDMPHHHVGVQWMSIKAAGVVQHRDACVLEVRDMFTTDDGVKGFASLMQSIDIPECPPMDVSHGLVRMDIQHTGYMFTEIQPGLLDVVQCMHVDFKGTLPSFLSRRFMKKRVAAIASLDQYFKQLQAASRRQLHSVVSTKQCACCLKLFGRFEAKKQCSVCHDRVCKLCYTTGLVPQLNKILPHCIRCVLKDATTKPSAQGTTSGATATTTATATRHSSSQSSRNSAPTSQYTSFNDDDLHILEDRFRALSQGHSRSDDDSDELGHYLDIARNLVQPGILDNHDMDPRMSSMSDGASSVISSASTGVWKDAISNFHMNLRTFKEGMQNRQDYDPSRLSTATSVLS